MTDAVRCLRHVSTPYSRGRQDDVRSFYGGVLGLVELCRDPFGNLIELTTILGDYRL